MSLDQHRAELLAELESGRLAKQIGDDWPTAEAMILRWWNAYKDFERADTAEAAFRDERMTIRWARKGLDYTFAAAQATPAGGEGTRTYPKGGGGTFSSNVGMMGVIERMDASIFVPATGASRKTELGLHDLSASLLKKSKKITTQLHNAGSYARKTVDQIDEMLKDLSAKNKKKDEVDRAFPYYVFMPLSKPGDQKVFQKLNELAKLNRQESADFYTLVRDFRSKMTRIKLACEHDMGCGFMAMAPDSTVNPKFRYGHQAQTKKRIGGLIKPNQENDQATIHARKANAMDFDRMLLRAIGVNEITIAYRYHASAETAGDRFPMMSELKVKDNRVGFEVFGLTKEGRADIETARFIDNMPLA